MINKTYEEYSNAIVEQLNEQGFVLLTDALTQEPNYGDSLERVDIAHQRRYDKLKTPQDIEEALKKYAEKIGIEITEATTRRFSRGDFTLQDFEDPFDGYELIYMHAPYWQESFRGEVTYTPEDSQPIIVPVTHNALAIIRRKSNMRSFVKQVTHHAGSQEMILTILRSR